MRSFARITRRIALPVLAAAALSTTLAGCGSGISLDEPIEGPAWRLVQLGDEPIAPNSGAQVQFDRSSGRVSGSGGCNRLSGTYTRAGISLKIGQLASTRMACLDPTRGANEAQFISALQNTASYSLAGPGRLALLDAGGRTVATFSSAGAR
ncbi:MULTISPECIES: META domain-containing protein [Variovorax]|jgi:heat shock protein HslJ|uniref:META domain-containing protein n=1 Tax=Variovorax TaxID=34072 RepID=UPI00086BA6F1|nr:MULTISPECIES: META domain-containing protein [Variovorax]MBN8755063.1 META domain-containing protein [Variovorax sp.]ODU14875.1 MAG: heat-shock protein [Variovorax sp. SCN 67-85]ODV26209.1 MAG: heat-shock protein [Variovorax sp. SCN 67-20]OJZ03719.1 MAG: heat-shock protein [Variovorax sp. 67-131]UKI07422.1 META domain-containing protein [Variovorax paradoxus]